MLTLRYKNQNVQVGFRALPFERLSKTGFEQAVQTLAQAYGEDCECLAIGSAFCSPQDAHDPSVGRKLAFGRLVKRLFPIPENATATFSTSQTAERKKFWDAYLASDAVAKANQPTELNALAAEPEPPADTRRERTLAESKQIAYWRREIAGCQNANQPCTVCVDFTQQIKDLEACTR